MRDEVTIINILKTLYDRQNDDDNTYENTIIQFFEAPHDFSNLSAWIQVFLATGALTSNFTDNIAFKAKVSASPIDPSTFTWAGYDATDKFVDAGWNWDSGGVYR